MIMSKIMILLVRSTKTVVFMRTPNQKRLGNTGIETATQWSRRKNVTGTTKHGLIKKLNSSF